MFHNWMKLAALGWDSQEVIALRMMKLARGGPGAAVEASLMVSEKAVEAGKTVMTLASGGSVASVLDSYHKKVRSNQRRLRHS